MKIKSWWRCRYCEKKFATWIYMPDTEGRVLLACDNCVPRGCSCNESNEQDKPCCEWFPIDKEDIEENPEGHIQT